MDAFGPCSIEINLVTDNTTTLHDIDFHMPDDFEHLRAFTEGYNILSLNLPDRVVGRERFAKYHRDLLDNIECRQSQQVSKCSGKVNVHPITLELVKKAALL